MTDMRVSLAPGRRGDVEVGKFTIERGSLENVREAMRGRGCQPGEYTELRRNGRLWMSDTSAEQRDHYGVAYEIRRRGGRVLVGGLGLGMIVAEALRHDHVTHVDVVEIDPDVAALVGDQYAVDPRVSIHVADMYAMTWPPGTRWDVAWFDIWADLCTDNLHDMARLARSYGRRCDWSGYWGKELLQRHRRAEKAQGWWR